VLPTREKEPFKLNDLGSLTQGIEDFNTEDVFRSIREYLPGLILADETLSLLEIKQIAAHVKSETS